MSEAAQRRHVRDKRVIDHLAKKMFEPKQATKDEPAIQSSQTETGLPVEAQVRKKWNRNKGGLPIF